MEKLVLIILVLSVSMLCEGQGFSESPWAGNALQSPYPEESSNTEDVPPENGVDSTLYKYSEPVNNEAGYLQPVTQTNYGSQDQFDTALNDLNSASTKQSTPETVTVTTVKPATETTTSHPPVSTTIKPTSTPTLAVFNTSVIDEINVLLNSNKSISDVDNAVLAAVEVRLNNILTFAIFISIVVIILLLLQLCFGYCTLKNLRHIVVSQDNEDLEAEDKRNKDGTLPLKPLRKEDEVNEKGKPVSSKSDKSKDRKKKVSIVDGNRDDERTPLLQNSDIEESEPESLEKPSEKPEETTNIDPEPSPVPTPEPTPEPITVLTSDPEPVPEPIPDPIPEPNPEPSSPTHHIVSYNTEA